MDLMDVVKNITLDMTPKKKPIFNKKKDLLGFNDAMRQPANKVSKNNEIRECWTASLIQHIRTQKIAKLDNIRFRMAILVLFPALSGFPLL